TTTRGYSRGDDTRARVMVSALKLFGLNGFEGASTRAIATDAGVNAPSVQYYFTSKEGLYLACVEGIIARLWSHVGGATARAQRLLDQRAGHAELIEAYCTIQERMLDFVFSSRQPWHWVLIIVRGQAGLGPDAGFRLMHKEISAKLMAINSAIVGRLSGRPARAAETRIRTMTLNGQLFGFLFLRRSLLTSLGWDRFDDKRVDLIKRIIRKNTERLLSATVNAPVPARRKRKHSGPLTYPASKRFVRRRSRGKS
ncbi:MAG: TetR family transcriptional regulator, partial [Gammaproteobacteria bacterium]|nr:TetR family transcriptional regulator [Gammaproteobacteria bacterium]